ncbi:phosphoribosylanthranilate isomerase [Candidatus Poriferisocius sp.]|uniref:phosphoribosylanthranilate isomerase n=1 Tax=Candidatus Poriferisocius sp. TaxID=3101276 RepID=UPI003B02B0D0
MFIKICGITTADDALLATALGADALGFIMAPSTRQIAPPRVEEIVRRIPSGVLTVGVFRDEAPGRVIEIVNRCGLGAAQLSGRESVEDTRLIREDVPAVIKAFAGGSPALSAADRYGADIVMVDSDTPGSGQVFDWSLAEGAPGGIRLLMAGGLTPENVATAIAKVRPWGVDVATGVEMSPGRKDPALLRAFISAARGVEPAHPDPAEQAVDEYAPYDWREEEPRWQ